ncbi:sodium:proton antiporter [Roseomonas sp. CCTCC AB2023176]|uniref:sodium:proton antiporter n=1 Tax=Roseomonas sp. CCTCC AB2023176 TaxID=3342640 RepID=UPI0035D8437A
MAGIGAALLPGPALAAVEGAAIPPVLGLPFAGMLLSIALMPLLIGPVWHHHYGKIALGWALLFLLPFAALFGAWEAAGLVAHVALDEYLPFLLLLLALYTTGGGVVLRGSLSGSPAGNTVLLAFGTAIASIMGTTGAAMVMIRPVMRANAHRKRKTHVFVFFIFLVANIGGGLTPLGDPPLYLGFLAGVPFFWPLQHLKGEVAFCAAILLAVFYGLDTWHHRKEGIVRDPAPRERLRIGGGINVVLLAVVVAIVLMQGIWHPGEVTLAGVHVPFERLMAMLGFVAITAASIALTPTALREENGFAWGAMAEVAKLFAAIFVTMAPVLAMLRAGREGPMGGFVALLSGPDGAPIPWVYFWGSGVLSSFLDNAPTYLVFFNLAGGDAGALTTAGALTLAAISCGSVFMGANSYIGNAPNFMVKAIVEESGFRMPSFFGYVGWACLFLVPIFIVATFVFFR